MFGHWEFKSHNTGKKGTWYDVQVLLSTVAMRRVNCNDAETHFAATSDKADDPIYAPG